jgi:hypothetical protein
VSDDQTGWWPEHYRDPAFEVRRPEYSRVEGGDYTRGSEVGLPKTALRLPKGPQGESVQPGQGTLWARPYDHHTVEVQWGMGHDLRSHWVEMALVRSVYGAPSTVNDGVTLLRGGAKEIFPDGYYNDPTTGMLFIPPVYDGIIPTAKDQRVGLNPGRWYYYSIFFRMDTNRDEWKRRMTTATILPRDHHHAEYMWDCIPPYYRTLDDGLEPDNGPLRRFLSIFGFELDTTREFVESWQETYHIDTSPMRLLRRVGENLDQPYEGALGDIRYRSLLANLGSLYEIRGTTPCLELVCEAASKYQCSVSGSGNLMLLPDDSDFYGTGINYFDGTGSWAGLHPDTNYSAITPDQIAPSDKVSLVVNPAGSHALPDNSGRGSMEMTTPKDEETLPVIIACGNGITQTERELIPLTTGIPVVSLRRYGFTIQIQAEIPRPIQVGLMWFGPDGQPTSLLSSVTSIEDVPILDAWHEFTVRAEAPEGVAYLVPFVYFTERAAGVSNTISPWVYLTGAMVYDLGDINQPVATVGPDRYLTVGDPAEKIGRPDLSRTPPHPGYLMGEPE